MPPSLQHSTPIYDEIVHRLMEARSRLYRERVYHGGVVTLGGTLGALTVLSTLEAVVEGGTPFRTILLIVIVLSATILGVWRVGVPFLRWKKILKSLSLKEVATLVGRSFPGIHDRLRNILEIFEEQKVPSRTGVSFHPDYSPELIDASFTDLQRESSGLNFGDIVSYEPLRRAGKALSFAAAFVLILFVIPQFGLQFSAYRLLHCGTDFRAPAAFSFLVQPGNAEIVKGESVPVTIALLPNGNTAGYLHFKQPKAVMLSLRQTGFSAGEEIQLRPDSTGQYRHLLPLLKQTTEYSAEAEGITSSTYTITVIDRPLVRSLAVHLTPPAYSGLPPQSLDENIGDVNALAGTVVRWRVVSSKELRSAAVMFNDGKKIPLVLRGGTFVAEYVLRSRNTYRIALEDQEGFANANPIDYTLDVVPDELPTVAVIYPGRNIDVANEMNVPLRMKIHDDFGFTALRLAYRLIHSRYEEPGKEFSFIPVPLQTETKKTADADVAFEWDASTLHLVPEDVIEYHAEVFDNDNVSGPKKGISESYLLRLPSLDEVFADADKNHGEAVQKLDKSLEEAAELKKNLDELSQEMKKNQPLDWQRQKKAEETLKRYEELTKKVDEIAKSVDAMTEEMQKNNILSSETLQKYMELQQLLQQINSPEFQEAMKKMQQAMQSLSPDQMRQAMQQAQFSEEVFRQSIERTMELLKRIQVEQKMDEMVKRANDLRRQEENLQKETASSDSSDKKQGDDLARKQDDINKELSELQKQLADLRKKMEEFPKEMPMKELGKAEQAANDSSMEHASQQSAQQLRQSQKQQAMQHQQKAKEGMEQMARRFSEMQEQMLNNQNVETLNALRKAMNNLLELSQQQEDLKNRSQALEPNSQQFRENAQQQLNIQGSLSSVTNDLAELSQKSFAVTPEMGRAIGRAMGEMEQAMNGLEQRNGQLASAQQGEAMSSLNKAASLVQSSMDALQQGGQGGGAGSLLQQLRRMAGQQQNINMQTEQLPQGQGMSQQQLQEMGRLAKQQDAVRKSLEELNKEAQQGQDRSRVLGDLQKIADEMKEVVENLQQNNVNPNTIRQQQRILSRMLDAQTSMRERDFEQRRTSTAGITPVRRSPADMSTDAALDQLRRDLLKAAEEGYSKDYQDLIRKYYDALNKEGQN